jgi:large repetitive protein
MTPCAAPDTPAAPAANRGDQSAAITFGAPGDQGCAIDQYQIQTDGGATQTASGSPHTFSGLNNGTSYRFRVRANNEVGWGAWSDYSAAVTPAGPPIGPNVATAEATGVGEVTLGWSSANANGSPITEYQYAVNGGGARAAGTGTRHRVTGLSNNETYSFTVRACNAVGCGAWSRADSATTWGPPSQVPSINADGGNQTATANWGAPANNGGTAITGYEVDIRPGGVDTTQSRSRTWNGLTNGTTYSIRARACNAVGCGAWSSTVTARVDSPQVVRMGKGRSAVNQPGCGDPSCAWYRVEASGFQPNTSYQLECHDSVQGRWDVDTVTTNSSGQLVAEPCYLGYPGRRAWVVLGGVKSNEITW